MPQPTALALPGQFPREGQPATSSEQVLGLRARDERLRAELTDATRQRDALTAQLRPSAAGPGLSPQVSGGVEARVRILDARILEMERERSATEAQLTATAPAVLARAAQQGAVGGTLSYSLDRLATTGFMGGTAFGGGMTALLALAVLLVGRRIRGRRSIAATRGRAPMDPRVAALATAVDAVAVEVERIGEGQRFVTQLLVDDRSARELAVPASSPAPTMIADPEAH